MFLYECRSQPRENIGRLRKCLGPNRRKTPRSPFKRTFREAFEFSWKQDGREWGLESRRKEILGREKLARMDTIAIIYIHYLIFFDIPLTCFLQYPFFQFVSLHRLLNFTLYFSLKIWTFWSFPEKLNNSNYAICARLYICGRFQYWRRKNDTPFGGATSQGIAENFSYTTSCGNTMN